MVHLNDSSSFLLFHMTVNKKTYINQTLMCHSLGVRVHFQCFLFFVRPKYDKVGAGWKVGFLDSNMSALCLVSVWTVEIL